MDETKLLLKEIRENLNLLEAVLYKPDPLAPDTAPAVRTKYGYIKDLPDQRDYQFTQIAKKITLPASVDLRPTCSPVEDQGDLGSCTANALVGALEFLEIKDKLPATDMSRLFVYYNERVIEHTVRSDSGAMIRDGIKTLASQGCCSEAEWPYNIDAFITRPITRCYMDALKHIIQSYYRITTLADMKNCLAAGYPFVIGFTVYSSFESSQVTRTGVVPMPGQHESVLGGHAVLAVGYDDHIQRFLMRNSWGTGWGMKGYFTIPYEA